MPDSHSLKMTQNDIKELINEQKRKIAIEILPYEYADLKILVTSMPFYDHLEIYMHVYNYEKDIHRSSCIFAAKGVDGVFCKSADGAFRTCSRSELSHKRHNLQKPYRISPNYHTYPYKSPTQQILYLQSPNALIFVINTNAVGTHFDMPRQVKAIQMGNKYV